MKPKPTTITKEAILIIIGILMAFYAMQSSRDFDYKVESTVHEVLYKDSLYTQK